VGAFDVGCFGGEAEAPSCTHTHTLSLYYCTAARNTSHGTARLSAATSQHRRTFVL